MNQREFNGLLTKLRNDCIKYDTNKITLLKNDDFTISFSNEKWKRTIECPLNEFRQMVAVGYFYAENQVELESWLNFDNKPFTIQINRNILFKNYKNKSLNKVLPKLLLVGILITLFISVFLF